MKGVNIIILYMLVSTATLVCLGHSSKGSTLTNPGFADTFHNSLLGNNKDPPYKKKDEDMKLDISLQDYSAINPVPSTTTSNIRPKPIQHGSPLMPFVPRNPPPPPSPSPTSQPKHGLFP